MHAPRSLAGASSRQYAPRQASVRGKSAFPQAESGMIRLSAMRVRFWGTRGSIAAPGPSTAGFGGNTSCVEVRAADGTVIILDCGTGARELGLHLAQTMPQPIRLHLCIGHTHWDHIQGFPFFVPAFLPGSEL